MLNLRWRIALTPVFFIFLFGNLIAQSLSFPRPSPKAMVSQRVGISDITIDYHRPATKGRTIWGDLVSYEAERPWRAGANENTTIAFTHDVRIEGQDLTKGTYGLFMIPGQENWTIIFSKDNTAWGSYSYDPQQDALRVEVQPSTAPFRESLQYEFTNATDTSVMVQLHWAKLKVGFEVSLDLHEIVFERFRNELKGQAVFDWRNWDQAAGYCAYNNVNLEEGLEWANRSISGGMGATPTLTNHFTKSQILEKMGRMDEAQAVLEAGFGYATMRELHRYGRYLIKKGRTKDAVAVFERNRARYPNDDFLTFAGLARGYEADGQLQKAAEYYEKAVENAPPNTRSFYVQKAQKLRNTNTKKKH